MSPFSSRDRSDIFTPHQVFHICLKVINLPAQRGSENTRNTFSVVCLNFASSAVQRRQIYKIQILLFVISVFQMTCWQKNVTQEPSKQRTQKILKELANDLSVKFPQYIKDDNSYFKWDVLCCKNRKMVVLVCGLWYWRANELLEKLSWETF